MPTLHADLANTYAYIRMERELASYCTFHSLVRTKDEIIPTVQILSEAAGLDEQQALLLRTAAWFQDLGRIEQHDDHRLRSAQIAGNVLPVFGFAPEQVAIITDLILATRMPQTPRNELESIIADADLAWLGQTEFFEQSQRLRTELIYTGVLLTDMAWHERLLRLLQSHHYHTPIACELYDEQKLVNLHALAERIAQAKLTPIGPVKRQDKTDPPPHPLAYLWRANTRPEVALMIREQGAINS